MYMYNSSVNMHGGFKVHAHVHAVHAATVYKKTHSSLKFLRTDINTRCGKEMFHTSSMTTHGSKV